MQQQDGRAVGRPFLIIRNMEDAGLDGTKRLQAA
jgi:hypothetical protein